MFGGISLKGKVLFTTISLIVLICIILLIFTLLMINRALTDEAAINNHKSEVDFDNAINRDMNIIEANLAAFTKNENFKNIFLNQTKNELYDAVFSSYDDLKKAGITELNFINLNGEIYLRMSDKNLFGDAALGESFEKTKNNAEINSGIELSEDGFVLRAIVPYYYDNKLIGYVEMAEKIDWIIELLSENGKIVYIINKSQINQDNYSKILTSVDNQWNRYKNYVVVSGIPSNIPWEECVTEKNIELTSQGLFSNSLRLDGSDGNVYSCGAFPVYQNNQLDGYVFSMKDMSANTSSARFILIAFLVLLIFIISFFSIITHFMFANAFKKYNDLITGIKQIQKGNYDINLPVYADDEVGKISRQINEMSKEIKNEKERLEDANVKLALENNVKNEFISIASHELLTPTSVIEGYSSMILDDKMEKMPPRAKKYLEKIYGSSQRLAHLVKEILDVSSIEQHKISVRNHTFDVVNFTKKICEEFLPEVREKNMELEISKTDDEILVFADPYKTGEIISNFINNSLKYSKTGKIKVGYSVKERNGVKMAEISVADQGIGIPKEEQKQIFQKFFRSSNGAEMCDGGSGLGLYISLQYAKMMNGDIVFQSELGKGSNFYLYLTLSSGGLNKK